MDPLALGIVMHSHSDDMEVLVCIQDNVLGRSLPTEAHWQRIEFPATSAFRVVVQASFCLDLLAALVILS